MGVHELTLAVVQTARFVEHLIRDAQLAEVMQQAGDLQFVALCRAHPQALGEKAGQAGDAGGMFGGEGALGIDDLGEHGGQLLEFPDRGRIGRGLAQHLLHHGLDAPGFEFQPEGLGERSGEEGLHQLGLEIAAGAGGDLVADARRVHEEVAAAVMGRGQGVDSVHQIDEVGLFRHGRRQVGHGRQLFPMGVVVTHGHRQPGQGREVAQQAVADLAMLLGALPVEFQEQVVVGGRRGDADVMQHAQVEQEGLLRGRHGQFQPAGAGHDPDPFAMAHVVDADQVQGVGQGVDDLPQIDGDLAIGVSGGGVRGQGHRRLLAWAKVRRCSVTESFPATDVLRIPPIGKSDSLREVDRRVKRRIAGLWRFPGGR